jgi:pimeloyl-ACP methyl ester carboxylesterase
VVLGQEFDISVRSHRLHAQRFGSPNAPLVIGLHGLSLNMKAYDFLGERIGGDEFQLVAFDMRGRGRSDVTPPGTYGWENHARDVFAVADVLGFERFSLVGQSMGGSVAMKAAQIDAPRLDAIVLSDLAGRVDRGVGTLVAALMDALDKTYSSVEEYLIAVRASGLAEPWNEYWERCYRYALTERDGLFSPAANTVAVAEDRAYGETQDVYERWKHLTMPTLLLRATQEVRPGVGHVVPAGDRDAFIRDVASGAVVEVDANHLTINTHPHAAEAVRDFLRRTILR